MPSATNLNVNDHVLSHRLGPEEFLIIGVYDRHYRVRSTLDQREWEIYQELCQVTPAILMANRARRQVRAQMIGQSCVHPGKSR